MAFNCDYAVHRATLEVTHHDAVVLTYTQESTFCFNKMMFKYEEFCSFTVYYVD